MQKSFLKEGAKVKAYVFFKGRSIVFKDKGRIILLRFAQELEELGKVESIAQAGRKAHDHDYLTKKKK